MVESGRKLRGLAIGDGANDVSMIQSASLYCIVRLIKLAVGVGIIGREGSAAARSSDYAIPRFKHLVRLLAVHGRYSYLRNSDFLHLSIYKNMVIVFIQLWFCIFCGYSGQVSNVITNSL